MDETIDVVFAKETVHAAGGLIRKGSHWPVTDPVVRQHPDLFSSDPRYGLSYSTEPAGWDAPVEQATKAPGEKRQTRRGGTNG